ncbi:conserved protein of unknown function (plasmid) [Rhodovastum atsumiense]|uniref:Uncharacterized protein n=1 Tax=Rhodovastum atsumiense TaxID=504468 RepID=A0A5M6IUB9_9PROT|nr:hypothetical protein [Rhodovastum atsumiense]KAA5611539.1 hypothetical protein F1189_13310 [Rhodovastum atsumiense]CAH2606236.1 conserved protein of unknown function [Rhodovastum atsumiense]
MRIAGLIGIARALGGAVELARKVAASMPPRAPAPPPPPPPRTPPTGEEFSSIEAPQLASADPVVSAIVSDLLMRSAIGMSHYSAGLERKDLDVRGWLEFAYEEHLAAANYLKRAIMEFDASHHG